MKVIKPKKIFFFIFKLFKNTFTEATEIKLVVTMAVLYRTVKKDLNIVIDYQNTRI